MGPSSGRQWSLAAFNELFDFSPAAFKGALGALDRNSQGIFAGVWGLRFGVWSLGQGITNPEFQETHLLLSPSSALPQASVAFVRGYRIQGLKNQLPEKQTHFSQPCVLRPAAGCSSEDIWAGRKDAGDWTAVRPVLQKSFGSENVLCTLWENKGEGGVNTYV